MDYRNNQSLPRGFRNNNPGNIIITNLDWMGKVPVSQNTDGFLEQFTDSVLGIRAMMIDIINDVMLDGSNTLRKIITEFAGVANPNYINSISEKTGINPDANLNLDYDTFLNLISTMIFFENNKEIEFSQIQEAFDLVNTTQKEFILNVQKITKPISPWFWIAPLVLGCTFLTYSIYNRKSWMH